MSQFIIDVSEHQGKIDWEKVNTSGQVVAAIIRCGYGRDIANQDDDYWEYNASECERLGIPYGVYLYSYAQKQSSVNSEVQHTLRLLQGHKPTLPVFFDSEQKGTESFAVQACNTFCNEIAKAGYKVGLYTGEYWFNKYFKSTPFLKWIAKYGTNNGTMQKQPNIADVWAWQYTSKGTVDGINGRVDMSVVLQEDKFQLQPLKKIEHQVKKSVDEIAHEVINAQWGSGADRKARLEQAGYDYNAVQARVNEILAPKPHYTVEQAVNEIINGQHGTGDARKQWCESVGLNYNTVQSRINAIIAERNKPKYSVEQAANEIIAGHHGTGADRESWCRSVGLDYNAVQNLVNQKLSGHKSQPQSQTARKSITQVAKEVIQGKWGNNPQRAQKLRAAGYDPNAVQKEVNRLM